LTSIAIPNSVTSIGDSAFQNCSGLHSVIIPDLVTSIGSYVFGDCSGLTSVIIGNSVKTFDNHQFYNCSQLSGVTFNCNPIPPIDGSVFQGTPSNKTAYVQPGTTGITRISPYFTYILSPPVITQATTNGSTIYISWSTPSPLRNVTVISYQVTSTPVGYNETSTNTNISFPSTIYGTFTFAVSALFSNGQNDNSLPSSQVEINPPPYPCFKSGSKILTDQGYRNIEDLRKGDLVKTLLHDYLPIVLIGKRDIVHLASEERIKDQLYVCSQAQYSEVWEDLVLTGCHSILVDDFVNEKQKKKATEINSGRVCVTDGKYRLPAVADERALVYDKPGTFAIYHLALENDDYYMNYGIYANGLLVETCSKRYLKELSNMELIE
jgi:hypothetical protein